MSNIAINVKETEKIGINIEDIINMVNEKYSKNMDTINMDNYIALELDYNMNYTVEELKHISKYYKISIRKKKKGDLATDIVIYELDPENDDKVYRRKYLWECINSIKEDKYLSKFLNITI
jgi:hypothetical protein